MTPPSRAVLDALLASDDPQACLALVLEAEGSTYVRAGAMALFGTAPAQVGWLSGGCLEPAIAQCAAHAAARQRIGWMQIDTREDEDLFAGSAIGCRGRLRLALLPLAALPAWAACFADWWQGDAPLCLDLDGGGNTTLALGADATKTTLAADTPDWDAPQAGWSLQWAPPPRVALFGAGPETPWLLPLLRGLGWHATLIEARARWVAQHALADRASRLAPDAAVRDPALQRTRAALVMHHHFERDRDALEALAPVAIPYIGLLGPQRRREDLFRVLPADAVAALRPRLHSPVGLRLGGQGAEAIALSIAAELQQFLHGG
jgi:xanthine dehydrogenase accessory factor